jgi:hypothetical protein
VTLERPGQYGEMQGSCKRLFSADGLVTGRQSRSAMLHRHPDTEEVTGSNPVSPTRPNTGLALVRLPGSPTIAAGERHQATRWRAAGHRRRALMARQSGYRLAGERKRHSLTRPGSPRPGVIPGRVSQIERGEIATI